MVNSLRCLFSGLARCFRYGGAFLDGTTMFGYLCLYPINAEGNVYSIDDRLVVGVVLHDVHVEECEGFWRWCGCKAQYGCAGEIVEDGLPFAVYGPVTFVHDDEVEVIGRHLYVIAKNDGFLRLLLFLFCCALVLGVLAHL